MSAAELAERLEGAWSTRSPIEPPTDADSGFGVADAYEAQRLWAQRRERDGETLVGIKIGLTSPAVQAQMGVDEPDYGLLWGSRFAPAVGDRAVVEHAQFIAPRVEGELAFLLGEPPPGPIVTAQQVLAATEAVAPAIEIVDSRIRDWRIRLPDTVADNASYGGFTLGPWSRVLRDQDLRTLGIMVEVDGVPAATGVGAAALGHPAAAVAWLLTRFHQLGSEVKPGAIVLSGALAPMIDARLGMSATLRVHGQRPLIVRFE